MLDICLHSRKGASRLRDQATSQAPRKTAIIAITARRCDRFVAKSRTCQLADQALASHQRGLCLDRLLTAAQAETCQACDASFTV